MNDEIKEKKTKRIIEKIEGLATYVTIPRELAIYNVNIDSQEAKLLIDYITNLQQRIEYLERSNNRREDTIMGLRDEIVEYEDYKSRIEKAVEYIKINFVEDIITVKTLLNILNGRSDE